MRSNWGSAYEVGQVPVYVMLLNEGTEGVGFVRPTWSLSAPFEYRFTDTNPAHYDLFDVRYLILHSDRQPPVPAEKVAERGRHVLWETPDPSYVDLVDVLPPISADRTNLGLRLQDWFRSDLPGRGANPGVAFEGEPAPEPTVSADDLPDTPAGTVVSEDVDLRDGLATATVVADRPAMVMLKASFDPRWQVTVDGISVAPEMIAPELRRADRAGRQARGPVRVRAVPEVRPPAGDRGADAARPRSAPGLVRAAPERDPDVESESTDPTARSERPASAEPPTRRGRSARPTGRPRDLRAHGSRYATRSARHRRRRSHGLVRHLDRRTLGRC